MGVKPLLRPIVDEDGADLAAFLHSNLNPRVSQHDWLRVLAPPWHTGTRHHGYLLITDSGIVGASVVLFSQREWEGRRYVIGNLAALSVLPGYGVDAIRLLRRQLQAPRAEFTDLTPTSRLLLINERMGFVYLDTRSCIVPHLPCLPRRGVVVTSDSTLLAEMLIGQDARIYQDHVEAPATRHILIVENGSYAYVVVRRQRWARRRVRPLIALPLYVGGERGILQRNWSQVASHILVRHGLVATYAERRIMGFVPRIGIERRSPRKRMFRSCQLSPDRIDYLYSDLTLLDAI